MKIRIGFVSNSSTSSFICSICEGIEAGMDLALDEAGMIQCEKGHVFHRECGKKEDYETIESEYGEIFVSEKDCPICNLSVLTKEIELDYLRKFTGLSKEKIIEAIKKERNV
jgi:hypothetical protein